MLICCAEMENKRIEQGLVWPGAALLGIGLAVGATQHGPAGQMVAEISRCAAVALLAAFALRRRSVTVWIVVAMVAGVELGLVLERPY